MFGRYAAAIALITVICGLFDFGLANWFLREIAAGRRTVAEFEATRRTKARVAPGVAVVVGLLAAGIVRDPLGGVGLAVAFLGMWQATSLNAQLRASGRFAVGIAGQVLGRGAGLAAVAIGLAADGRQYVLGVALAVGWSVEWFVDWFRSRNAESVVNVHAPIGKFQRSAIPYGWTSMAALAQQLDTPLVTIGAGTYATGIYAAASRLLNPLTFPATALGQAAIPSLGQQLGDRDVLLKSERRILRLAALAALVPLAGALLGFWLIPLLLGPDYRQTAGVFAVLAIGGVFRSLNVSLATVIQNRGGQASVARSVAACIFVGLLCTLVLAWVGGAVAAGVGFVITQSLLFAVFVWRLRASRSAELHSVDSPHAAGSMV
jgi:O-antigen/teichoic acid export membrane protein